MTSSRELIGRRNYKEDRPVNNFKNSFHHKKPTQKREQIPTTTTDRDNLLISLVTRSNR